MFCMCLCVMGVGIGRCGKLVVVGLTECELLWMARFFRDVKCCLTFGVRQLWLVVSNQVKTCKCVYKRADGSWGD